MKKLRLSLLALLLLVVSGCSSSHMEVVAPELVDEHLGADESAIVFIRATSYGGGIQAPVAEVNGQELTFVSIVSSYTKALHKTTPGKHNYVVGGETSSMLEADLAPGKIYYVQVEPFMGLWKARFELIPIIAADLKTESFKKDLGACKWVQPGATAQLWFEDNLPSMKMKALEAQKKILTLRAEDGVDTPVEPIIKKKTK